MSEKLLLLAHLAEQLYKLAVKTKKEYERVREKKSKHDEQLVDVECEEDEDEEGEPEACDSGDCEAHDCEQ